MDERIPGTTRQLDIVPPGYKRTEEGVIPEDWKTKRMEEIGSIYGGLSGKSKRDFEAGNASYVTFLSILENILLDTTHTSLVHVAPGESQNRVQKGDLLFNGTSETPDDLAIAAVMDEQVDDLFLNSFCFGFRIHEKEKLVPLFLAYIFRGPPGRAILNAMAQGATRYNMSKSHFLAIEIAMPNYKEQRGIAEVLSDVDGLLASLEALIAKKRVIKQAAMQQLLTGQTRLPRFRGKWETKHMGKLGFIYGGLSGKSKRDFGSGNARYVTFLSVLEHVLLNVSHTNQVRVVPGESQNRVLKGDLLFNGTSETPDDLAIAAVMNEHVDGLYLNSFCFGFRIHEKEKLVPLFLAYFFRGTPGRAHLISLAQGATRYNMSKNQFLAIEISIPDYTEQRAIAAVLSDMDAEITALERRRDKTRAIKQGMMQQLLTGRVRLVEPDPVA